MTRRTIRVDAGVVAQLRGKTRAVEFLRVLRSGVPLTGCELRGAVLRCPDEESEGFLRAIQRALEGRDPDDRTL